MSPVQSTTTKQTRSKTTTSGSQTSTASQAIANSNAVRISPRKVGLVASLVRGRTVEDALVILENTPKRAATPVMKTIMSAKANAEHNHGLRGSDLIIDSLQVGPGPRFKRFRPVSRGRAHGYIHRTSNIRVVVSGAAKKAKPATKTDPKKGTK